MWELLVPTVRPSGKPFKTRFHKVWDKKVRQISKGLTIMPVSKGQWISPKDELFVERMIPVRIACTKVQIELIMGMTLVYYEQEAVLCYKISDEVLVRYR